MNVTADARVELADSVLYERLRTALPLTDLDAAIEAALRLRAQFGGGDIEDRSVLVCYGGGKDSSYALAFVRCMQLVLATLYGSTFRMRVVTNRHAGMPKAVMTNIDRAYRALALYGDPHCELLCVDGDDIVEFDVDLPLPDKIVQRNRTDILMTGHRAAGDGRPTFCNACNLSMVRAFAVAGRYAGGIDVIVTGDSPEEQRAYLTWVNRLARAFELRTDQTKNTGFNRVLELFDGISRTYFADIHGAGGVHATLHTVPHQVGTEPSFFSIYAKAEYRSGSHWEFLTDYLGFVFDDIAFSFSESDCGNPGLMAHLRGLRCEYRYGRSYAEGIAEYLTFATRIMRDKDFPGQLIEAMQVRYAGEEGVARMRERMTRYAEEAYGLTEEQLVCMVYAPFVDEGAALSDYLAACQPELLDQAPAIHGLLGAGPGITPPAESAALRRRLVQLSGLSVEQLGVLYRKPSLSQRSDEEDGTLLGTVRTGDPHKGLVSTRRGPNEPAVLELISGR